MVAKRPERSAASIRKRAKRSQHSPMPIGWFLFVQQIHGQPILINNVNYSSDFCFSNKYIKFKIMITDYIIFLIILILLETKSIFGRILNRVHLAAVGLRTTAARTISNYAVI